MRCSQKAIGTESDSALAKGQQQLDEFVERTLIKPAFPVISEHGCTTEDNTPQLIWGLMEAACGWGNLGVSHRLLR